MSAAGGGPRAARTRRPTRDAPRSDLRARILAAIPLIAFAVFIVVQGGLLFVLAVFALGVLCLHELYGMLDEVRPVKLVGFAGLLALVLCAHYADRSAMVVALVAVVPVLFVLVAVRPHQADQTLALATTMLGIWWIGLAVAHAVLLRDAPHGGGILVDVLVGTFLGDTGAYLGGRAYGRRVLAPRISPGKTREGLVVGVIVGTFAVWFAGIYQDWLSGRDALLLGLAVAVAAPLGDLFESMIKRDVGVKDTARTFGAHGGALDRLDAVLFTVVVGYYVWTALN